MMENQYIVFETAKLANEKGFKLRCECFYNAVSGWKLQSDSILRTGQDEFLEAPTQAQLQKWLRGNGILVGVEPVEGKDRLKYAAIVKDLKTNEFILDGFSMYTEYEDAIEDGLQEALKTLPSNRTYSEDEMRNAMTHIARFAFKSVYFELAYREIDEYLQNINIHGISF